MMNCPNCGGGVAPGDRFCGHCRHPLSPVKTRKGFGEGVREALPAAIGSAGFGLFGMVMFMLLTGGILARYLGENAGRTAWVILRTLLPYIFTVTVVGGAMDLLLSGLCANSKLGRILCALGVMAVFCLTGVLISVFFPSLLRAGGTTSEELMAYAIKMGRGVAPVAPLLHGALFCCADGCGAKKTVIRQLVILAAFLVLTAVLIGLMVVLFGLGMTGTIAANAAAVLVLMASLVMQCIR